MPIYEYVCEACGKKFEKMRSISEADQDAACPDCQKPARRKLSTFACYSTNHAGTPTAIGGTGASSCSSCSSGNCSTCGS